MARAPLGGMTLVEMLIVGIILSILAWVVAPQFSSAGLDVRNETLRGNLGVLRERVAAYQKDHGGKLPSGPDAALQLTLRTNAAGDICPMGAEESSYPFGPYLPEVPANPFLTGPDSRRIGTRAAADRGEVGWFLDPATGEVRPGDRTHAR